MRTPKGYREWFRAVILTMVVLLLPLCLPVMVSQVREGRWGGLLWAVVFPLIMRAFEKAHAWLLRTFGKDRPHQTSEQEDIEFGRGAALGGQITAVFVLILGLPHLLLNPSNREDWLVILLSVLFFLGMGVVRRHAERKAGVDAVPPPR